MKRSSPSSSADHHEAQWTLSARLVLLAAILFIGLNVAQVVYRFTIPSLGWAGLDPETEETIPQFRLLFNAVGAPSPLQPGDTVLAVDGIPSSKVLEGFPSSSLVPADWEAGKNILLTIMRDEETLEFEVPLVHWTPAAWWVTNLSNFPSLWNWLVTLLLFGTGTFTFSKRPGNLAARFLFIFGLSILSGALGDSVPDYIGLYFHVPAGYAKALFSNIIFAYLLGPSFLGFSLTFPRHKGFVQRQSRWLLAPFLVGAVTIPLLLLAPKLAVIGFYLTLLMLLFSLFSLIHTGLTMRDAISRAQLRWAVGGVVFGVALFLLNFASNQPPPFREIILSVASLGFPIIGFSLSIAILRYRLFDIDIVIRRTLQYIFLTGLLVLMYYGGIVLLQGLLEPITGDSNSPLITVITTLGIAALFNPLRIRVQAFIDRRFFRKKYDAEQALNKFAIVARDEVDIERLTEALLGLIGETVQPDHSSLWLRETAPSRSDKSSG